MVGAKRLNSFYPCPIQNGNGLPTHIKGLTDSAVTILEQLKNATGIDIPGLLQNIGKKSKNGSDLPKELA